MKEKYLCAIALLFCALVNDIMGIIKHDVHFMIAGCFILLAGIYSNTIRRD